MLFTGKAQGLGMVWVFHRQMITTMVFREQLDCKRQDVPREAGKCPLIP